MAMDKLTKQYIDDLQETIKAGAGTFVEVDRTEVDDDKWVYFQLAGYARKVGRLEVQIEFLVRRLIHLDKIDKGLAG